MTPGPERSATLSDLVAEEIRALMARRRMTGRALADMLDVSPSWVSYRLTGTQPIDLNDLERIADALDVKVGDLIPSLTAAARLPVRDAHRPTPSSPRPHPKPKPTRVRSLA